MDADDLPDVLRAIDTQLEIARAAATRIARRGATADRLDARKIQRAIDDVGTALLEMVNSL
jgi:hypothetical protein